MHAPYRLALRALVVYTGASILVVEILATRMLAPYFGSSLITLSSVLGVTLGALSTGYYVGGLLAERSVAWSKLGMLIAVSGGCTLAIWPLSTVLLEPLTMYLSVGAGAIMASILIFLVPCGVMGTLSPYVIALEQSLAPGIVGARAAGNIFFWSTLGSIIGSISAGFVLIPLLGVRWLIVSIGASLLIVGCLLIIGNRPNQRSHALVIGLALLGSLCGAVPQHSNALFLAEGVYQRIAVHDITLEGRNLRVLWQDRNASSGVDRDSDDLAFDYTRVPAVAWTGREAPRRSLVIGAGAFVIPDTIAAASPESVVDAVDIEPGLEDIATRFFRHNPNERVRSIVADGRVWLRGADPYDLIVGDAYQAAYFVPVHLTTREFFVLVKDRLTPNGMFVGNFIGSADFNHRTYFPSAAKTLRTVFPQGRFFAVLDPQSAAAQNIMFIGCKDDAPCVNPCSATLRASRDPILSTLCDREIAVDDASLEKHMLLTDDYAPVEWLIAGA